MKKNKFDILFLCHEKDYEILKINIEYAKKNIIGYRKIFVLSKNNFFPNDPGIEFIDEKKFPFNSKTLSDYAPNNTLGGYLPRFIKLYVLEVLGKRVLDNLLIIDADCTFIKKTTFFEANKPLYNYEIGYYPIYYKILEKVFGFGEQIPNVSGTVHHMLYQRKYIKEILNWVRKNKKKEFWQEILDNAETETTSSFSEQDMYFQYMLKFHKDKIKIRRIKFIDFPYNSPFWVALFSKLGYYYVASHDYLRRQRFSAIGRIGVEILKAFRLKILLKKIFVKLKIVRAK